MITSSLIADFVYQIGPYSAIVAGPVQSAPPSNSVSGAGVVTLARSPHQRVWRCVETVTLFWSSPRRKGLALETRLNDDGGSFLLGHFRPLLFANCLPTALLFFFRFFSPSDFAIAQRSKPARSNASPSASMPTEDGRHSCSLLFWDSIGNGNFPSRFASDASAIGTICERSRSYFLPRADAQRHDRRDARPTPNKVVGA